MSCSSAPISSRSGRGHVAGERGGASAAVSTRCRSTVKRCTGLRCGRLRTRSQSGSSRSSSPAWSSASQTPTAGGRRRAGRPARRAPPRATARAAAAARAASRSTVAIGAAAGPPARPRRRPAARSDRVRPRRRRGRARPRSPARRRRRRAGGVGAARGGDGEPRPTRRHTWSTAKPIVRRGLGDRPQQRLGVEQAERHGDRVLLLEHEPVGAAAGDVVQRVPYVEEQVVRRP